MFYNDLDNFSKSDHTHTWETITNRPSTFTPSSHNHNDLYYTESEIENKLGYYSKSDHNHDSLYSKLAHVHTWDSITSKPSTFTPSSHTHTWDQVTDKPSTYAPSSHNHNDIYYTETEITNLLKNYALIEMTSEDIGEGVSVVYPDNTLICVYE